VSRRSTSASPSVFLNRRVARRGGAVIGGSLFFESGRQWVEKVGDSTEKKVTFRAGCAGPPPRGIEVLGAVKAIRRRAIDLDRRGKAIPPSRDRRHPSGEGDPSQGGSTSPVGRRRSLEGGIDVTRREKAIPRGGDRRHPLGEGDPSRGGSTSPVGRRRSLEGGSTSPVGRRRSLEGGIDVTRREKAIPRGGIDVTRREKAIPREGIDVTRREKATPRERDRRGSRRRRPSESGDRHHPSGDAHLSKAAPARATGEPSGSPEAHESRPQDPRLWGLVP
jgi:hypothetical protein